MTVKVAAFDFDGTLRRGRTIAPRDIAAIDAWRDAGHLAISATGRSRSSLAHAMRSFPLTFDYNVLSNGAAATTSSDELLFAHSLYDDIVHHVVSTFRDVSGIAVYGTTVGPEDGIFANNTRAHGEGSELARGFIEMAPADIPNHTFAVVPLWVPDNAELREELIHRLETELPHVAFTMNHEFIDIIPHGVNKGAGIAAVIEHAGLEGVELISFGDSWNDVPMHEVADVSYSFHFSPDDVQVASTHVIEYVSDALLDHL